MQKFVSNTSINQIILPLTSDEAESLEDYLTEALNLCRDKEEFVVIMSEVEVSEALDGLREFSLLSYGRYDKACFTNNEKIEIEEMLLGYGRQWFRNNGFEILESIH